MVGRFDEVRQFAALHEKAAEPLSPHHRVHSVTLLCEIEDAAGGWSAGALASPGIRMGLLRGDRAEIERWLDADVVRMFVYGPGVMTARLDALGAIRDSSQIEQVAPAYIGHGLLLEPFALRALGIVRGDDELLSRADALFVERNLEWHRSQTERLLAGI